VVDQDEIHMMVQSEDVQERKIALYKLHNNFSFFPDKKQAWGDLLELSYEVNSYMVDSYNLDYKNRNVLADPLVSVFAQLTDKEQAWKDLLEIAKDKHKEGRRSAVKALGSTFVHVTDKDRAWKSLLELTKDEDREVRLSAVVALGIAFAHVIDKEKATKNLLLLIKDLLALTKNEERGGLWRTIKALGSDLAHVTDKREGNKKLAAINKIESILVLSSALDALNSAFVHVTDKEQAWKDLLEITKGLMELIEDYHSEGEDSVAFDTDIRPYLLQATITLILAFDYVTDKYQAWKDLLELTKDTSSRGSECIALIHGNFVHHHITDKEQAWKDLLEIAKDKHSEGRGNAVEALGHIIDLVTDKDQAIKDLISFTKDENREVRISAARAFRSTFFQVTDKDLAWKSLLELTKDEDREVRKEATSAFSFTFSQVTDKDLVWKSLLELTKDENLEVRKSAGRAIYFTFSHVTDKDLAWKSLLELTKNEEFEIQFDAGMTLRSAFSQVTDKDLAWKDLVELTKDENSHQAEMALCLAFSQVTDKDQATKDLILFTKDENRNVRLSAVEALGSAFAHVTDTDLAWKSLLELTKDEDSVVRKKTAIALSLTIPHVTDKDQYQVIEYLLALTKDENRDVRISANHSSGMVSIYRASQAEDDESIRKELETALRFFEKASKESTFLNPAKFCLPFYRSFYAITFRKEDAEAEVKQYLAETKKAVESSEIKEKLLEAVENLGNALNEVHKARDFNDIKSDLNAYRWYCDRACELLDTAEEKVPGASRLIRRGLPIIDERIKGIIAEIQEKSKELCKQTKGTTFEDLGKNVYHIGQNLLVENPVILEKRLNDFQISLSAICARTSENIVGEACDLLKRANNETTLENRIQLMDEAISKILPHTGNMPKKDENEFGNKTPNSPIELHFQEKQDTIKELAKKFSAYQNRRSVITEEVIKRWLLQFGNIIRIKFALRLLENIDYYEPWQMKEIFIHIYEKVIHENDREKIVISLLGNLKDSSSIVNYTLGEEIMRYKLESHPLETILDSMKPDKNVIVFIDDNIGSGKQAVQIFREWFGIEIRDLNESHVRPLSNEQIEKFKRFRIYLCTFVGFEDGKENVSVELKKMGLNVVKIYSFSKLEEEIGCFHKALKTFDNEEERVQAENMVREIGIQLFEDKGWPDELKNERSLGYGNSQKLIVFYYNTPTSTLPILWKEGKYNSKKWLPLFPRREKK